MPTDRLLANLDTRLAELDEAGRRKGRERAIRAVLPAVPPHGPRYLLEGDDDTRWLRMNANAYLGMALRRDVIEAEARATADLGAGPGAVRFISGTWAAHVTLERRLAAFHRRGSAMLFSSAYAAVMGTIAPLVGPGTAIVSDALNHNSIINGIALARPSAKYVYKHLDLGELERALATAAVQSKLVLVITDGIFSMRGDHAPLARINALARAYDTHFADNVVVIVDDSHGVGACGTTGRGTEELEDAQADVLIATLGKALGVNGGYVAGHATLVDYLRETSPFYIYSNPISQGEASAAARAVEILDSTDGRALLDHLRILTARFRHGLGQLGHETLPGEHPVVPLLLRDTARTQALVAHLRAHGILATGLGYPVVPHGDEEIRFQVSADHTAADIDYALDIIARWRG